MRSYARCFTALRPMSNPEWPIFVPLRNYSLAHSLKSPRKNATDSLLSCKSISQPERIVRCQMLRANNKCIIRTPLKTL